MGAFVRLAEGVDILPLLMAVERQAASIFFEKDSVQLFFEDWTAEYFAFPQVRPILLDTLRRAEAGQLHEVSLLKIGERFGVDPLPDSEKAMVVVSLGHLAMTCGGEQVGANMGSVIFCTNAAELVFSGLEFAREEKESYALAIVFSPMP